MKIRTNKLVAALIAIALVFGAVSVAAGAANTDPYVLITSISNVTVGSENQKVEVCLSPDTELKNASIVLSYADTDALKDTSVSVGTGVTGETAVEDGKITLKVSSAANTSTTDELVMFTISFDFAADAAGLVELTASAGPIDSAAESTIASKTFGVALIKGEDADDVYSDFVGIGLKDAVKAAGKEAPLADAKVVVTLKPFEGSTMAAVDPVEIEITDAICGTAVMTKAELPAFLDKNADAITAAIQAVEGNSALDYNDFDIVTSSVVVPDDEKYAEGTEYIYSVTLNQLEKTTATIKLIFRPALEDTTLYHSSDIAPYEITMSANVGKAIYSQSTILTYIKNYIDFYNEMNGNLDIDGDGIDDYNLDGVAINQHIKDESDGKYDLGDFVLDETVVGFNNAKIVGGEKFSADPAQNVYTVYFDQVNVPATVLGAAAEAFGSIDYSQFVKAQVFTINETIDAFQAFVDSLVNAEWPTAEDVEEDEDDSESPSTGSALSLGAALASVVALASAAVVAIKKRED